jgi:hypothetical protein
MGGMEKADRIAQSSAGRNSTLKVESAEFARAKR